MRHVLQWKGILSEEVSIYADCSEGIVVSDLNQPKEISVVNYQVIMIFTLNF
jgi:hypothetical protein